MSRKDYPLCPFCKSKIVAFIPPKEGIEEITLYCSSGACKGVSLTGNYNGYIIKITDLTSPINIHKTK